MSPERAQRVAEVVGATWTLLVQRVWDRALGQPRYPHDALPESVYRASPGDRRRKVVVASDGATVEVESAGLRLEIEPVVRGTHTSPSEPGELWFELDEGLAAGGRLVLRETPDGVEAELTVYGSGFPIVASERGPLVRDAAAAASPPA